MTRNEMLQRLQIIKTELELIEVAATVGLKAYAGEAVGLTMAAVCHAIDLVSISEEVKVGV